MDPRCAFCQLELEDSDHLFLHCPHVQECWQHAISHNWISSDFLAVQHTDILQKLLWARTSPSVRLDRIVPLLWSIWKTRNQKVFRNETSSPLITLIRAKKASAEWRIRHKLTQPLFPSSNSYPSSSCRKTYWVAWRAPPGGSIKVNFDGAKTSQGAAGGFIIRDWEGQFIQAASFRLGSASVLVAEATALRNGIHAAVQAGFTHIQIEGDNKTLIQAVQGRIQPPWEIQVLIHDIHMFMQRCISVTFFHIFREDNRAADWLARFGLSCCSTSVWHVIPHRDLGCILYEDNLGRTLERRAA